MARQKISVDWNAVSEDLASGQLTRIEQFATARGISRPTAKKLLAEHYGNAIIFVRGRSGGIVYNPANIPSGANS